MAIAIGLDPDGSLTPTLHEGHITAVQQRADQSHGSVDVCLFVCVVYQFHNIFIDS